MSILGVRFPVKCVFGGSFDFLTLKIPLKAHSTVKRTSELHIQNTSVIDPLKAQNVFFPGPLWKVPDLPRLKRLHRSLYLTTEEKKGAGVGLDFD
jgi:hypothetical protein